VRRLREADALLVPHVRRASLPQVRRAEAAWSGHVPLLLRWPLGRRR